MPDSPGWNHIIFGYLQKEILRLKAYFCTCENLKAALENSAVVKQAQMQIGHD
jgi:hypothetical protein